MDWSAEPSGVGSVHQSRSGVSGGVIGFEGVLEVAKPPCLFAPPARRDLPRHDIEAKLLEAAPVLAEPGCGSGHQPSALGCIDGEFGRTKTLASPGLDLYEDHAPPTPDNEVQLDAAGPDVASDDAVPFAGQVTRCPGFAFGTEREMGCGQSGLRSSRC